MPPWLAHGPTGTDYQNFYGCVLRVFLAFAEEACKLTSVGWKVDRIRAEAVEFLRRLTIEAYYSDRHDSGGRKLREMTSRFTGGLLSEVEREYQVSGEWRRFEQILLAATSSTIGDKPTEVQRTQPTPDRSKIESPKQFPTMTVPEVCNVLSVSRAKVYRYLNEGKHCKV